MTVEDLSEDERTVYEKVKIYLKKKPFFSIKEILGFLAHRLRGKETINRRKIESLLKGLIKKKYITFGTKIVKENVLDAELRKQILDLVKINPGINMNGIMDGLDLGANQAIWHLKFLTKFEMITSVKMGNEKAFFTSDIEQERHEVLFYFRNEKAQSLIRVLEKNSQALGPTKISELSGLHYNTTKKYLKILVDLGLSMMEKDGKAKKYKIKKEKYQEILQFLKERN